MSKETKETNPLNLPQNVLDMSAELQKQLKPGDDGVIPPNRDLWKSCVVLDTEHKVTEDEVKRVQQFERDFFLAATHATSVNGEKTLTKNKELERIALKKLYVGSNAVSVDFYRAAKGTKGFGANAEAITHYGHIDAEFISGVGSTSTVHHKAMRDHFHTLGAQLWGDK